MFGVFAKVPRREPVKTRLRSLLTTDETQRFHVACLADTLETAGRVVERPVLFVPRNVPGEPEHASLGRSSTDDRAAPLRFAVATLRPLLLDAGLPSEVWSRLEVRWQIGPDLGARIVLALQELCQGTEPGLLVGSDSPSLGSVKLERALDALGSTADMGALDTTPALRNPDVVLGPAADGGFYAIGTRHPVPGLLRNIPWSTHRVLRDTRRRCDELGLRVTLLEPWTDVDRPEDLRRLATQVAALRRTGDLRTARHVESVLRRLGLVDETLRWTGRP